MLDSTLDELHSRAPVTVGALAQPHGKPKHIFRMAGVRIQSSVAGVRLAAVKLVFLPTNLPSEITAFRGRSHRQRIILICLAGELFGAADVAHGGLGVGVAEELLDDE
jgi:hypothetical protein